MKTPAEAIIEWNAGLRIDRSQLLRALVEFDSWVPPISNDFEGDTFAPFAETMMPLATKDDVRLHPLCSYWDAMEAYKAQFGDCAFGDRGGWEMFGIPWRSAKAFWIDPGTPQELIIPESDLPTLKVLAEAVAVERAWKRISKGNQQSEDFALVVDYGGYHLPIRQGPEGAVMIHVPHDDGSMFAPIFTHVDALVLAIEEMQESFAAKEVRTIQVSGAQAFPVLAKENAKGLIFNFRGPTEPLAFELGITGFVLNEAAKRRA